MLFLDGTNVSLPLHRSVLLCTAFQQRGAVDVKTSSSFQAASGAFFGHPTPSPHPPPSHQWAHQRGPPLLKRVPGANPALEHFPAKNTAAAGCSEAPHLAVGRNCNLGIALAAQVGLAGLCQARWVEELRDMLQNGVGGVSGV